MRSARWWPKPTARGAYANVIFVNQPWQHDLLRRPDAEVATAHAEMAATPPDLRIPENRVVWERVLDRLRARLEQPVELRTRTAEAVPAVPRLRAEEEAAFRAGLDDRFGAPALEVVLGAEGIATLGAPAWSTWLRPERWRGATFSDLGEHIDREVGRTAFARVESGHPAVEELVLSVATEAGARTLSVHRFVDHTGGWRTLVHPRADER